MKSEFITHITEIIPDKEFLPNIAESESTALSFILDVSIECFDWSFNKKGITHLSYDNTYKLKEELIDIFDDGHKYWLEYVEHIRNTFTIELSQFGFIMIMNSLPEINTTIKKYEETWNAAIKEVIRRITDAMYDSYKKSVDDAKLAKAVDYMDEKTLGEFFRVFQELKDFYKNREKYDTEDKLEKHNRMIEIYQYMIRHVDF